jgi:L-malate glycosyltransferase
MKKKKIHYHSDCQFFAGCENMLVNFFTSKELMNKFRLTFSYRDTPIYRKGLYKRVKPKIACYPLKLPYLSDFKIIKKLQKNQIGILIVKIFRISTNIPILIYEIYKLKKLFLKIKPDIVHINSGGYPPTMSAKSAIFAARLSGVKKIILVVNNLAEKYNNFSRVLDYPLDKVIAKNVNLFITASVAARDRLKNVLSLDDNKILNIHNGIKLRNQKETVSETRKRLNLKNSKIKIFGIVALLIPRKGHKVLINAIEKILEKKITNFIVLIEGQGILKKELKNEIKEKGLYSYCKFIGVEDNIVDFIAALDCLILPSIENEDFPNVVLEAMGLGRVVIASNLSGITEQIIHKKTGFLFNKGDNQNLANLMIKFITNKYDLKKMRLESKKKFMTNFTDYISVKKYIDLYNQL